jgi:hypothetical protein
MATAAAPLAPSRNSTASPGAVPNTRSTFVAPVFPDPSALMSCFQKIRTTIAAQGIDPTR